VSVPTIKAKISAPPSETSSAKVEVEQKVEIDVDIAGSRPGASILGDWGRDLQIWGGGLGVAGCRRRGREQLLYYCTLYRAESTYRI